MTWPRRFLPVPTSALLVDPAIAHQSPKGYTDRELQEMAATVPAIYARIGEGATERDFLDMRLSADSKERQMGETYAQLFRDAPSSHPLAASYDGHDLVVDKGNHRIRAAQEIGVPVVPVWVSAPTDAELDQVQHACDRRIEREGASAYRDAHLAHEQSLAFEPTVSRERGRPETREAGWRPERDR